MPYFIEQVVDGWNTVKDDGTLLGKHKTKQQAISQMVAVSLSEGIPVGGEFKRAVDAGMYTPTEGVAVAAKRALEWIAEGLAGSGFTAVGRARATQLASGRDVSADVVNRMISYFARHEVDKEAEGFSLGDDSYPSAGRVAWDAWGGDAGQSWVNGLNNASATREVAKINNVMSNNESDTRMSDEMPMTKDELVHHVGELKGEVLELVGKLAKTVEDLSELVESITEPMDVVEDIMIEPMVDVMSEPMDMEEDSVRFVEPTQVAELAKRGERVSKGIERRQALQDLEIRAEGDGMTLRGYAAVFNSPSEPLPFTETIQPGAFSDSLRSRNDIKLLWNHDTGIVLGSTRAGTLKLIEDERGLLVEASLPDTQAGRDAATLIKRGDVSAFSFGFRVPAGGDSWPSANQRVLTRVNIHEASLVAFPAYSQTEGTASVRGMSDLTSKIMELAELRGISADELTDALLALEAGSELTERQGELLTDTLNKVLQKDPEVTNPAALLDLKKKQLDLLMQRV
jgi:HK97 family phage prohead protease